MTRGTQFIKRLTDLCKSPMVSKILGNFSWLIGEKAVTLLLSLTVSVWLARYLGPDQFGLMSYAVAFVGLFSTFTYLGLSGITVRDLVERPEDRNELLGTVFTLKLIGALIAMAIVVVITRQQGTDARELVLLLSLGMLFQSVGVIRFWFESRIEGKYTVAAPMVSSVVAAALNVGLILIQAPLAAFVAVIVVQHGLTTAGLFYIYWSRGYSVLHWRFRFRRARRLLHQSWPLMLSSMGAVLYLKVDQVMLGRFAGNSEVGIYAVAVKFSEVWYFLPTALAASLFPKIVKLKSLSLDQYNERMQRMYRIMVVAALGICIAVTLTAIPLMSVLYGAEYDGAAQVLMIHIWACPAVFMAAVLSKWLISEGLLMFSLTRHGLGAVVNILLNLLLIPQFGAIGAAIGTVISYTVASYLACFSDRRTFATGIMMTRALLMPFKDVITAPPVRIQEG